MEWKLISLATMALLFSSAASLSTPLYFGRIIGVVGSAHPDKDKLNNYAIILFCIFAAGGIATMVRGWLFTLVGERLVRNVRCVMDNYPCLKVVCVVVGGRLELCLHRVVWLSSHR